MQQWWSRAETLDATDTLRDCRSQFHLPLKGIYLDGNSLGAASQVALACLQRVVDEWKNHLIRGWTEAEQPWFTLCEQLAGLTAPLLGAQADQIAIANSTTINLHHLVSSLFAPTKSRRLILADQLNFPSDLYALQGQLRLRGLNPDQHLRLVGSDDGRTLSEEDIVEQMSPEIALVLLPSVLYRSGQLLDIAALVQAAHQKGALIGFDLSHSIGALPHQLDDWEVDFAFWCNYKYVNGGPGAPAGLYINRKHFHCQPGLPGWWGSDKSVQFAMEQVFVPAGDAGGWQVGTPSILAAAPLQGALELLNAATIERVRAKSLSMTSLLIEMADQLLEVEGFTVGTPREAQRRGGHVALEHDSAWQLTQALIAQGTIPDFRPPNIIRLAPSPLYNTHRDVCQAVLQLRELVLSGEHLGFPAERGKLT